MGTADPAGPADRADPADPAGVAELACAENVLADTPSQLWGPLLRALRRAVDDAPAGQVPPVLRPYARWKPDRLAGDRPRRAVAGALASDGRLRERVGEGLEAPDAWQAAERDDIAELRSRFPDDVVFAALTARGRFWDLAPLVAETTRRLAAAERAAADRHTAPATPDDDARKLARRVAGLQRELKAHRRRADVAERRAEESAARVQRLQTDLAAARGAAQRLSQELNEVRRAHRDRLARLQRRVSRAESEALAAQERVDQISACLEDLAAETGGDTGRAPAEAVGDAAAEAAPEEETPWRRIPREVPAAVPGRPCRLPAGTHEEHPAGVRSLLRVPGLQLLIDGYNVSMDARGFPTVPIADQRAWLLKVAAGVAARYRVRPIVVFDGQEARPGGSLGRRGVLVVFSDPDETADERIVAILERLPAGTPALVVSSDREVKAAAAALHANTTGAATFLTAVGS